MTAKLHMMMAGLMINNNKKVKDFSPAHIGHDDSYLDRRDRLLQQKAERQEKARKQNPWWM